MSDQVGDASSTSAQSIGYFDDDLNDPRETRAHAVAEGIVLSLAIGVLLWALIGLGISWL